MVQQFADGADREMASLVDALNSLARSSALAANDYERFREQAVIVANAYSAAIALREPSGLHIVNTLVPYGSEPMPMTSDPILREADELAMSSKAPVVSGLYIGVSGKRPFISIVLPISRQGRTKYLLTMAVTPELLQQKLQLGQLDDEGWFAAVIGTDGRLVARSRESERFIGKTATKPFLDALKQNPSGSMRAKSLEGIDVYTTYEHRSNGLTTVVSVPVEVLEAPVYRLVYTIGIISIFVVMLSLLLAGLYARRLGKELSTLARNADRMGSQLPLLPYNKTIREVSAAQHALVRADEKVRLLLAELNHRVNNTLSVIVSLVSRGVSDEAEQKTLFGRVGALAHAHEALSGCNWDGVSLASLLTKISAAQGISIQKDGPEIVLTPRAVTCLAQVFQELISNVQRHASPERQNAISVSWSEENGLVLLEWLESGSMSAIAQSRGFGLTIVELCIVRQLDGTISIIGDCEAWKVHIEFPVQSKLGPAAYFRAAASWESVRFG